MGRRAARGARRAERSLNVPLVARSLWGGAARRRAERSLNVPLVVRALWGAARAARAARARHDAS